MKQVFELTSQELLLPLSQPSYNLVQVPGSLKDADSVMYNTLMLGFQPLGP